MGFFRNVTAAAALVASVNAVGQAQTVQVQTTGCFVTFWFQQCTLGNTDQAPAGFGTLTFDGGLFTNVGNTVDLGHISVDEGPGFALSIIQSFHLNTAFMQPANVDPSSQNSSAFIDGVFLFSNGSYNLDFTDNNWKQYTYDGGSFEFKVNDPNNLTSPGDFELTGSIRNLAATTTPEPGSLALLGTGLIGLVPMVRRRRK